MSSIPYNYGKYVDDTQKLRDQGHVDAGKQVQSPASAGSRGLNKTVQFTKDPTQMKMGNSPIAESMVEIRNILNRIDGVNVPVKEDAGDEAMAKEIAKVYDNVAAYIQDDSDNEPDDQGGLRSGYDDEDLTDAQDLADAFRQGLQSGLMLRKKIKMKQSQDSGDMDKGDWDPFKDEGLYNDLIKDILAKYKKPAVREDEDELARLKELAGIEEDAGLTDQQKKGLEAIAKKYKGREGYNGDFLPIGYIKAIMSTGVGTDGMDGEEVEAFAKKLGKDVSDIEDEWEDFETLDNITNAMKGDINDVLGNGWDVNQKLADAAKDYLYDLDESYEPFPEADEMTFEDDDAFYEAFGELGFPEDENELFDAEYRGRKVPLNKPMRGDVKKFKVYVKDPKTGNVKKVNFGHGGSSARKAGQKTMKIRKSNPKARKSFRARHNCANPGPKTKARYWSCRKW